MQNIEFTSNELYFLLHHMRKFNEEIDNKYSNSIFEKVEKAFFNQSKEIYKEDNFKREYDCKWV